MSTSSIMTATMSTLTGDSNSNNTIAHEQGGQAQAISNEGTVYENKQGKRTEGHN
jgi:hypothetical protein